LRGRGTRQSPPGLGRWWGRGDRSLSCRICEWRLIHRHGSLRSGEYRLAGREAVVFPRLHRGSRTEAATAASRELFAGISGYLLRWKTAPDKRRPFLHLVIAGSSLRATSHTGMGRLDDCATAAAKAYSASSRVWLLRSSGQGEAERVIGAVAEGTAQQETRVSDPKWGRRMARDSAQQKGRLIPPEKPHPQTTAGNPPFADEVHTHILNNSGRTQVHGALTYRRPHLCVVRRDQRPSPVGMHWRRICRGDQRLHPTASDGGRHSGRLRASTDGRDAKPDYEVAACND